MQRFELTPLPLDEGAIVASVQAPGAGAVVSFAGRVRDHARGRQVVQLEYDAYPEMAERVFAQIAAEAKEKFAVVDIAVHHRSGSFWSAT
ncbi:MAG TPA: molybdenum cofactor biosynthesis protein MoaE [Candidatus Eremiobacteraceae bacterium]|nr:molybdenum cofactor biosynthesis protein MoaE [Candidatus Eremiobacteraceae bacterium]